MKSRATFQITLLSCALFAMACASTDAPSGLDTTGNTTGGTTGGTGTTGGSGTFSGTFTPVAAIYEGSYGGIDSGKLVINLLGTSMDCATWQDPNSSVSGYDVQLVLNGSGSGTYSIDNPNSSNAQNSVNGTGIAVDVYSATDDEVISMSGTASLTAVNAGSSVTGSLQITWDDNESLTVPTFNAQYCPDTNNWGGTFVPQSALFTTNGGSAIVLLMSQNISCDDWTSGNIPAAMTTWEVIVGATAAGTYPILDPNTATTGDALIYQTFFNATVNSEQGNVVLSNVGTNSLTIAVPSVTWSSDATSSVATIMATSCALE